MIRTGNKVKELVDGFKLFYEGANNEKRNIIGIILPKDKVFGKNG